MEDDMNEKLIKVLYFKGELILEGSEMLDDSSDYFLNLLEFIKKLK